MNAALNQGAVVDDLAELYERWVHPLYLLLLHGNFRGQLLAEELSDERTQMISNFRCCVREVEPSVVTTLIKQPDWRARLTGGWYAGLRGWRQFVHELGTLLLEGQMYACQGHCAALACFADKASAEYLQRHLDSWLPQADKFDDQRWALAALVWIDKLLETQYAAQYLVPGGLWDQWAAAHGREGPQFYLEVQHTFDLTLASALAAFRGA